MSALSVSCPQVDPDILTGYNVINFDMPYLLDRAATLRLHEFPYWSRLQNVQTRMKDAHFQSKAHGHRDYKEISMPPLLHCHLMSSRSDCRCGISHWNTSDGTESQQEMSENCTPPPDATLGARGAQLQPLGYDSPGSTFHPRHC